METARGNISTRREPLLKKIVFALIALYAAGFALFATSLPKAPRDLNGIEGVVALTGGGSRLDVAVALFEKGVGERLLISGVNPQTTKTELKALAHGKARFDCCSDLGYAAEDTYGNAVEAAAWARFHHYRRILLVTARYHMPRSMVEFRQAMPGVVIVPFPVDPESAHGLWQHLRAGRVLNSEYLKYLAVEALSAAGLEPGLDRGAPPGESGKAS